ncbi:hypothetical protein [Nocardioides marmorisolisilvae]|uniref:Uncharacterized protein n=1 Tax=Nocardioides marmorisolisilvae TaxID=1542737 RepID=A0A3N0DU65_9ACTN|nr:hypothetical protein [Nocardioides marmorisolisilvae]RNL79169.1 hypothetical protein EFL95_09065 [Nocardioides marmorisolisilvae]
MPDAVWAALISAVSGLVVLVAKESMARGSKAARTRNQLMGDLDLLAKVPDDMDGADQLKQKIQERLVEYATPPTPADTATDVQSTAVLMTLVSLAAGSLGAALMGWDTNGSMFSADTWKLFGVAAGVAVLMAAGYVIARREIKL